MIATNGDGDSWVVWESEGPNGQVAIVGRFRPHDGSPHDECQLSAAAPAGSARSPSACLTADGASTVVYAIDDVLEGDGGISGRAFDQPSPSPRHVGERRQ